MMKAFIRTTMGCFALTAVLSLAGCVTPAAESEQTNNQGSFDRNPLGNTGDSAGDESAGGDTDAAGDDNSATDGGDTGNNDGTTDNTSSGNNGAGGNNTGGNTGGNNTGGNTGGTNTGGDEDDDEAPPIPGDLDGDGVLGIGDYTYMLVHYGMTGANAGQADMDADGDVDVMDLAILQSFLE